MALSIFDRNIRGDGEGRLVVDLSSAFLSQLRGCGYGSRSSWLNQERISMILQRRINMNPAFEEMSSLGTLLPRLPFWPWSTE